MCTVSFIARKKGYALAMNRDEQLSRVTGLPPTEKVVGGRAVLAPSEPGGGTWIALNDAGVSFALINWYSLPARVPGQNISRGQVVNMTSAATIPGQAAVALTELPLRQINPFRLIGIFPARNKIIEWRWDLKKLTPINHSWKSQQWISSGLDEPTAQSIRSQTFRQAWQQASAGSLPWLRRLQRSHVPERGPFSVCMHRADAATVSCTLISVQPGMSVMRHAIGAPCQCPAESIHSIPRADSNKSVTRER